MKRHPLTDLPAWPRFLSREESARFVGVSPTVFDEEVRAGMWPPPMRRGAGRGRLTWDRNMLELAADRASGLEGVAGPAVTGPAHSEEEAARALDMINATSTRNRVERYPRKARGRLHP